MLSVSELEKYKAKLQPQNLENSETDFKKEIGLNLQRARAKTPLTQEDLALIFDCDERTIRRYEEGTSMCPLGRLLDFCKIYDCTLEDLLPKEAVPYVSSLAGVDTDALKQVAAAFGNILNLKTA